VDTSVESEYCWSKYGELMNETVNWFFKKGFSYREKPWLYDFLYKYSHGVALDLGSGIASTTREILKKGFIDRLFLLDLSLTSLMHVCNVNAKLICVYGDVLNPPFRESFFNTVYLLAILHHIPGRECRLLTLENTYRLLKPGGYTIITVWNPRVEELWGENVLKPVYDGYVLMDKHGLRYYHFYNLDELIDDLEETGFNIVENGFFTQNPWKPSITKNIYVVAKRV